MPIDTVTYTWISALIDLAGVALGWSLGRLVMPVTLRLLARLTRRIAPDDPRLEAVVKAVPWAFAAIAAMIAIRTGPSTPDLVGAVDLGARVVFTLIATFGLASLLSGLMERRDLPLGTIVATTLTRKVLYWFVVVVGCVIVLTEIGIEITPVLAALGVGSLAVGLALQPTLSNLFAGFNLSLNQRVRVGDFVRLDSGQEGRVLDIGWRATEIRSIGDSLVSVPNAKLAEMIVTNVSLPGEDLALRVEVGVSYASDLEQVERVALEVARAVQADVEGAARDHEPILRFLGFGDSSINFMVVLRAASFRTRPTASCGPSCTSSETASPSKRRSISAHSCR
jgi:small-conductance mechanosensitive channel